ncbi:nitrogen regulatory protein P-II family [Halanaerobium saccharolyticum]|jgi:nitrogen regulatory protein P-II 1|uniref:Nitrogen regulatory protein P-II family n=1 Tax=Halanaerobium saccharolyticum TaxID=43595 RepID=A0A2T5RJS5_9FIRM|nr:MULTISPECIES: P-II family nitrogen regulator [Halanaerobium]PTV98927.1 nitrogen regulatory protein P-II family [Halanaerobium saccharolyticum]PUU86236.1 MAG: nitrogen regulatory protein P-II [Halanaerobium sp.]PUU93026.1 MAG: nitrogen regulatory protein P-II [Halanaerobium sp.]TDP89017.1 nitrogen regulatory protein P-II family [Halanaerobium saccharolyticum]
MKKVEAFIRSDKLNELVTKLNSMGLKELNILEAKNFNQDLIDLADSDLKIKFTPMMRIEFVINYTEVDKYVEAIKNTVQTGESGDGKIYVSDIENSVKISTGEEGLKAIA